MTPWDRWVPSKCFFFTLESIMCFLLHLDGYTSPSPPLVLRILLPKGQNYRVILFFIKVNELRIHSLISPHSLLEVVHISVLKHPIEKRYDSWTMWIFYRFPLIISQKPFHFHINLNVKICYWDIVPFHI